jgi:hypothetical protein
VKANLYPIVTAYAFDSSDCVNFDVGADLMIKPFKYEFWEMKGKASVKENEQFGRN